jgi:hypothetical protein
MAYNRSFLGIGSVTAVTADTPAAARDLVIIKAASFDFKTTEKELRGNRLFPVASATTSASISGKVSSADISAPFIALCVPGTTTVASSTTPRKIRADHPATVIPAVTFQITVTNSATFTADLGVINLTTGKTMVRVTSTPSANQYSVSAGVYTFASQEGTVVIRYLYTNNTTGTTMTGSNPSMGETTAYSLYLTDPTEGYTFEFPAVKFSNLSIGMKIDDWVEASFDFTAYESSLGIPFYVYGPE